MSQERYQDLIQALADGFLDGDPLDLAEFYSHPLAIYHGEAVRVEATPEETAKSVIRRRMRLREAGAAKILAEVHAFDCSADGRLRLRVTWTYLDAKQKKLDATALTYFCRESADHSLKIDMILFDALAFPDMPYISGKSHGPH